jgi:nitrate reductase gamma subunit
LKIARADGFKERTVKGWYEQWLARHRRYLYQARILYNAGIVLLLVAVAVALIPPGSLAAANRVRLAAVAVVIAGATYEAVASIIPSIKEFVLESRKTPNRRRRRFLPKWPDAVAEAVIMLLVLGLMALAGVAGWVIGHFA